MERATGRRRRSRRRWGTGAMVDARTADLDPPAAGAAPAAELGSRVSLRRRRDGIDGSGRPHLSSWRRPMIELSADSDSASELEARGWTDIATGTSSRPSRETTADSSPSPSALVRATNRTTSSPQEGRRRKRRRMMATTSSPPIDRSPPKPPLLDMGENSEAAEEKNTDSSGYSSPLRRPKSLLVEKTTSSGNLVYDYNSDKEVVDAYHRDFYKYQKKLARLQELPTLKLCKHAPNITDWHDLKQKNAVLDVARSVLSLSSSNGDKEINRCTGIIIDWIEVNRSAIIVTSSQIICTKTSLDDWEDNNVYAPNAKVTAHLLDGTTSELNLLYFNKHYDIAFFKVIGGSGLQVASLDPMLEFGHEACVLARDKDLDLICSRTIVKALDPCEHQKNHYLFIGGPIPECCTGGALTNFDRNVVGMVLDAVPNVAFIPSSLILNCLRLWKKFGQLARPHLGLKLRTVAFMDISYLDHLSRMFNINSGLIVAKVSIESPAERNGIRVGDIIFNCQGVTVSTTSQFEDILLDVCEKQFEKGNSLNSTVDVELGVYNLRKHSGRTVALSVELSDCMEIFK